VPLTEPVSFKAALQKENRVQVPKLIRWQFKMETQQVLKVAVKVAGSFGDREMFHARMRRDGRITLPKLTLKIMLQDQEKEQSLVGCILEVHLEPAEYPT
jgi:hypothetical protein